MLSGRMIPWICHAFFLSAFAHAVYFARIHLHPSLAVIILIHFEVELHSVFWRHSFTLLVQDSFSHQAVPLNLNSAFQISHHLCSHPQVLIDRPSGIGDSCSLILQLLTSTMPGISYLLFTQHYLI